MSEITQSEYWAEIQSLAQGLIDEALEHGPHGKEATADELRDHIHDAALHETIDGHQWVIYNWAHSYVLRHSPNDEVYFQDFGPIEANSLSDVSVRCVFCAMERDVSEALETLLDGYEPQEAADDESEAV